MVETSPHTGSIPTETAAIANRPTMGNRSRAIRTWERILRWSVMRNEWRSGNMLNLGDDLCSKKTTP